MLVSPLTVPSFPLIFTFPASMFPVVPSMVTLSPALMMPVVPSMVTCLVGSVPSVTLSFKFTWYVLDPSGLFSEVTVVFLPSATFVVAPATAFQLTDINRICAVHTIGHVGDFVAAVVKAVLGEGYGVSRRTVIDRNAVIIHNCIAGGYTFEAFQGFGKTDFQVVAAIGYDAEVVFCGQFVFVCNASDDVHLFVQFLLDDVSYIAAVLHAVI